MKTVADLLDQDTRHMEAFKVIDMHDEAQWESPQNEVQELTEHIHTAFSLAEAAYNLRCPMKAEVKVGKTWAETH